MSSINTMLLVFNRGGPGSYRSRQRSWGDLSGRTSIIYPAKHSRFEELGAAFSEQRSSLEDYTQDKTSPIRLLRW